MIMMIGMVIGPLFAGNLADRMGDYRVAFSILATGAGLGSLLFLASTPPPLPLRIQRLMARRTSG